MPEDKPAPKPEAKAEPKPFFPHAEIPVFNEENPHKLLVIAWNSFQQRSATRATLVAVSETGFIVDVDIAAGYFSKKTTKRLLHRYEIAVKDEADFRDYAEQLFHRSNAPSIPLGITSFICFAMLAFWAICLSRIHSDGKEVTRDNVYYGYYMVFQASLALFPDLLIAKVALGFLAVPHLVEALYVAYLGSSLGMRPVGLASWGFVTFLFGFPIMNRVIYLETLKSGKGIHIKSD